MAVLYTNGQAWQELIKEGLKKNGEYTYDEEYLTEDNPKYKYPYYQYNKDYKVAIKKSTLLHRFYDFDKQRTIWLNSNFIVVKWQDNSICFTTKDKRFKKRKEAQLVKYIEEYFKEE